LFIGMANCMHKPIEIPEGSLYRFPIRPSEPHVPTQSGLAPAGLLELQVGDLVAHAADAIVVPCGGQVDLAVRRAAGPGLGVAFRRAVGALPFASFSPGQAVMTAGFALAARHVIHCLPALYHAGPEVAASTLAECYSVCLSMARNAQLESVAFPALGTGMRSFPPREAAAIAVRTVASELARHGSPMSVRFVLVGSEMLDVHLEAAGAHFQRRGS
jgi:O-acetyl-ADP-ribose deacetylase